MMLKQQKNYIINNYQNIIIPKGNTIININNNYFQYNSNSNNHQKNINLKPTSPNLKKKYQKIFSNKKKTTSPITTTNKKEENKEENLENVNNGEEISESESEPSRDNLDEIQIKKLFSIFRKKKIIKRKRLDNFLRNNYYFKKSKISTLKSKIFRDSEMKTSPHNKSK